MAKNVKGYLDSLLDEDGLKTDVKVTMTDLTILKLVGGLIIAGGTIAFISHALKNILPNKHLTDIKTLLQK